MSKKRNTPAAAAAGEIVEVETNVVVAEPELSPCEKRTQQARAIVARARADAESLAVAADEILLGLADRFDELLAGGYSLPIPQAELQVLKAAGLETDRNTLIVQIGRARRVKNLLIQAGSTTDRAAARATAEEAAANEAAQRPKLEEAIAQAEQQLARLESATATARADCEARESAFRELQSKRCLPPFVVSDANTRPEAVKAMDVRRRLRDIQTQLDHIEQTPRLVGGRRVDHAYAVQRTDLIRVKQGPLQASEPAEQVPDSAWTDYCAELRKDAPKLFAEKRQLDAELAELDAACSCCGWYTARLCD